MILEAKLRVQSLVQLLCLWLYSTLAESNNLSWMHRLHLIVQPIVFLATLHGSKTWSRRVALLVAAVAAVDVLVFLVSFTILNRCIALWTASCLVRIYDEIGWLVLATVHAITSFFQCMNLLRASDRLYISQEKRIRLLTWFLFVQDSSWLILTSLTGVMWLVLVHPMFNFILYWVSQSRDPTKFFMMMCVSLALLGMDIYLMYNAIASELPLYPTQVFLGMYLLTDVLYAYFCYQYLSINRNVKED
jgi:hypothetical protein